MFRKSCLLLTIVLLLQVSGVGLAQSPPIPIQYGQTVQGTITDEETAISYVFDGAGGDQITVTVAAIDGNLDPILSLNTFGGTLLATDNGANNTAIINYVLPAEEAYTLTVSRAAGSLGTFELTLREGTFLPTSTPSSSQAVPTTAPSPTTSLATTQRLQQVRIGDSVSGTLGGNDNFNVYWFEASGGTTINILPDNTTGFLPLLVLYRSDFTEIVRGRPGDVLNATLNTTDIYFLVVSVVQPGTGGNYTFTIGTQAATDSQDGLAYGDTANGSISNIDPTARFRFRGGSGDTVTIQMTAISGDLDSFLLLVDASGTTVATDDNSAGGTDAEIVTTLNATGDYFIIATRRGQEQGLSAGDFLLSLTSDAPPRTVPTEAPQLPSDYEGLPQVSYGQTINDDITDVAFLDLYVFFGRQGDNIQITMNALESNLDPLLILLDNNRIPLIENDDIQSGVIRDSEIEFELPYSGYYAIVATRFDQEAGTTTGDYEVRLALTTDSGVGLDTPILDRLPVDRLVTGATQPGTFAPLRLASIYTFSAAEGSLIDFSVTADAGTVATVILTDSNLNYVTSSNNGILLAVTAPRSDDYLVFVMPKDGPTANVAEGYIVALNAESGVSDDPTISATSTIAYGASVRGTITDDQPALRYVFQGSADDIVAISMTAEPAAEPLDTFIRLEGPDGTEIGTNDDIVPGEVRDSYLETQLPTDGEYTIVATRFEDPEATPTTGVFRLELQFLDPTLVGIERQAELVAYGQPIVGRIDDETYLRFYYFEGTLGDEITIEVTATSENLDAMLYLYTFTSAGDLFLLEYNDDSPLDTSNNPYISATLPRTAGYVIAVTRFGDTDTSGDYTLLVSLTNPSR